jgi:hypothetical protein
MTWFRWTIQSTEHPALAKRLDFVVASEDGVLAMTKRSFLHPPCPHCGARLSIPARPLERGTDFDVGCSDCKNVFPAPLLMSRGADKPQDQQTNNCPSISKHDTAHGTGTVATHEK